MSYRVFYLKFTKDSEYVSRFLKFCNYKVVIGGKLQQNYVDLDFCIILRKKLVQNVLINKYELHEIYRKVIGESEKRIWKTKNVLFWRKI